MSFDAVFLSAVCAELRASVGCRVDRVQQPSRDTVLLQLRGASGGGRLLLSASGNQPRIQMTALAMENPAQPPMFCMLLRKHLTGGRLLSVTQPPMERLVDLCFACTDELGEASEKHLILELMGRNANLILQGADGRILDCLRRVDFEMSEKRQLLPGLFYHLPPAPDKRDPFAQTADGIYDLLCAVSGQKQLDRWLLDSFGGLSPLLCRELAWQTARETDTDISALSDLRETAERLFSALQALQAAPKTPFLLLRDGEPWDVSCIPIRQYGDYVTCREAASFSALLDGFYGERDRVTRLRQKTQALRKLLTNLRNRAARKLELQRTELAATKNREQLRRQADLITANLSNIRRGQTVLRTEDYYDPELREVEIPLNPALSAQQNAAKLYKDYQKAKNGEKILTEQLQKGERELDYLDSVLTSLDLAESERDIGEIRQELTDGGYLREQNAKKRMKQPESRPMVYYSADGFRILVGRNNRQNDQLTTKLAAKRDLWLHVQKFHGAHVILETNGETPPDRTVSEAMMLAAWYSEARQGQNVPVDFTEVRNVKKPAGSKPGMVIYDRYRTAVITPRAGHIENMKRE